GSPRTESDDERTREVGQTHSTGEVSEQGRSLGGGGDGGKGSGQGEPEPAKRDPDSEPVSRAKRAGAGTTNGKREQGCEVHRSAAPYLPDRHPAVCLLSVEEAGGSGSGWGVVAALRRGARGNPPEPLP